MHKVRNYGGLGVVEHPGPGKAWKTATWRRLPGHPAFVDQCALGVGLADDKGRWQAIRKRTRLQVTLSFLAKVRSQYVCSKGHSHLPRTTGRTTSPTTFLPCLTGGGGHAPKRSCRRRRAPQKRSSAKASKVLLPPMPPSSSPACAGTWATLRTAISRRSSRTTVVIKAVNDDTCPTSARLAPPPQATKLALRSNFVFNERVLADTIWLQVKGRPVPVISTLDAATKFLAAR